MDQNATVGSDVPVMRERIEDGARIVADLGPGVTDTDVDVVEDVAIVVVDDGQHRGQFEIDLPEVGTADTFIKNGVLTIEVTEQ
jgi:hypothetical protein